MIVTTTEGGASSWGLLSWVAPPMTPLVSAGFATALVIFMLLERHSLRDRFLSLFGHGYLAVTTRALDEAATRVSRQLLVQTAVNATYGLGVGIGLFVIGVPYALLWAVLAAALRFIPYVGTLVGAAAPILVGLAALSGWIRPLAVVGLFAGLELFANLVLETVLYAGATGMSQVALLVRSVREVTDVKLSRSELIARAQRNGCDAICIADLPPGSSSRTRYAVRKIHAALPNTPLFVGRWAADDLADEQTEGLMNAGATHVGSRLLDTLDALQRATAARRGLSAA